jgi:hypothetical protein
MVTPSTDPNDAIIAYEVAGPMPICVARANPRRNWMDATRHRFAYRCLPMVIANQMGWWIANQIDLVLHWNGGQEPDDLKIDFDVAQKAFGHLPAAECIHSNFGEGVVTFSIPYLFRTPAGTNLWVRGPANYPKDGIQPLEGIVETDWSHATFTMNWKVTRPNVPIHFAVGEPICQIVPIQRRFAENLQPLVRDIKDDPALEASYLHWHDGRDRFIHDLRRQAPNQPISIPSEAGQHQYLHGVQSEGSPFIDHQTKLHWRDFQRFE